MTKLSNLARGDSTADRALNYRSWNRRF